MDPSVVGASVLMPYLWLQLVLDIMKSEELQVDLKQKQMTESYERHSRRAFREK